VVWQLDEAKKTRGERIEDGTAQRDRPLFEVSFPFLFLLNKKYELCIISVLQLKDQALWYLSFSIVATINLESNLNNMRKFQWLSRYMMHIVI
jgi:hypothetical protein